MDKSKITSDYKDSINSSNTKHLMLNWSESEIGHRHPDLPLGYVLRDQFQFDLFSGKSRLLLDGTGIILAMADYVTLKSKYTQITTQDITSFTINSKNINPKLFHTDYVLSMSDSSSISNYSVIGPQTYVQNADGSSGKIVDAVFMDQIFDASQIFETNPGSLPSADVETHSLLSTLI